MARMQWDGAAIFRYTRTTVVFRASRRRRTSGRDAVELARSRRPAGCADPVRSSHSRFVETSGLRWISPMLLALLPGMGRVWAPPFLTALVPSRADQCREGAATPALLCTDLDRTSQENATGFVRR